MSTPDGWWREVYEHDPRGEQIRVLYYDVQGLRTMRNDKDGSYHEKETKYDRSMNVGEDLYYDTQHRLVRNSRAGARVSRVYSPFGEVIAQAQYDAEGGRVAGSDGVHRLEIERDSRGRITREVRSGVASSEPIGAVEYIYREEAAVKPDEERHLGPRGELVVSREQPCAVLEFRWKGGDLLQKTCLGVNREFVSGLSLAGDSGADCARIVYTWERPGLEASETCHGTDAEPLNLPKLGYAQVRYWRDRLGRLQGISYLDASNHHVLSSP